MIAHSGSDATADSSISRYFDSDSTATVNQGEWVSCKTEENPTQDIQQNDWGAWRKYLKSLWLKALKRKQSLGLPKLEQKLYCLRTPMSISGWLARAGYRKKRN